MTIHDLWRKIALDMGIDGSSLTSINSILRAIARNLGATSGLTTDYDLLRLIAGQLGVTAFGTENDILKAIARNLGITSGLTTDFDIVRQIATVGLSPSVAFEDFDEINTELWYSLNSNAALTSTLSFGSGVSQITDVSGNGRNGTQGTGSQQPFYNATGLNSQPCITGNGSTQSRLNIDVPLADVGAILAVVELPTQALGTFGGFVVEDDIASAFFITGNYEDTLGNPYYGVSIKSAVPVAASGFGVAVCENALTVPEINYGWNSATLTGNFPNFAATFNASGIIFRGGKGKLGELVMLSASNSTAAYITQGVSILKSRWGIT